jgi:hypothetical protein
MQSLDALSHVLDKTEKAPGNQKEGDSDQQRPWGRENERSDLCCLVEGEVTRQLQSSGKVLTRGLSTSFMGSAFRNEFSIGKYLPLIKSKPSSFHHLGACGGLLGTELLKGKYVWKAEVHGHFS